MRMVADSLQRVHVGDTTFREDGLRRIWHRGGAAADVVSWVHRDGVIMRQEFTFGGLVVRWERDQGIGSGAVSDDGHASLPTASTVDDWHEDDVGLHVTASGVLSRVESPDFYLRHLAVRLAEACGEEPSSARRPITAEVTMPNILQQRAALGDRRWDLFEKVEEEEESITLWVVVAGLAMTAFIAAYWYISS
jgi:hypothetical protein